MILVSDLDRICNKKVQRRSELNMCWNPVTIGWLCSKVGTQQIEKVLNHKSAGQITLKTIRDRRAWN